MRWLARKAYLYILRRDDEKPDGWWPYRTGLAHWLGEFGWPRS